jgi:hypothetical protein
MWNTTGARCCVVGVERDIFLGPFFIGYGNGCRYCDQPEAASSRGAVNQLLKSAMREICTLRSVGTGGG